MKISLTGAIILAMIFGAVFGVFIASGALEPDTAAGILTTMDTLSKIFLRLIKTIV